MWPGVDRIHEDALCHRFQDVSAFLAPENVHVARHPSYFLLNSISRLLVHVTSCFISKAQDNAFFRKYRSANSLGRAPTTYRKMLLRSISDLRFKRLQKQWVFQNHSSSDRIFCTTFVGCFS